jgi:hypothetical protein
MGLGLRHYVQPQRNLLRAPFAISCEGSVTMHRDETRWRLLSYRIERFGTGFRHQFVSDGYVHQHVVDKDPRDWVSMELVEALREIIALDRNCSTCEGKGILHGFDPREKTYWAQHPIVDCPTCGGNGLRKAA